MTCYIRIYYHFIIYNSFSVSNSNRCYHYAINYLDTFASKVAAVHDKHADASVGNVTGSNAVNVFLGIGVAWSIAAIYHHFKGQVFRVDPGK